MQNQIKGAIYGVFIGDALGTTYEFRKASSIKLPNRLNIVGKGPFNVAKGQVTDDSEMTLALLYSIIKKGKYDKEDVAKAYIRWIQSEPADNGKTTELALEDAKNYKEAVANSLNYNQNSMSNGFLMRISPLAILGLNMKDKQLNKIIKEEVKITHPNKNCFYIAKLYVYMIKYIIKGGKDYLEYASGIIKKDSYESKLEILDIVTRAQKTPYFTHFYGRAYNDRIDPDGEFMGFVWVSLQIAFYVLYNAKSYEEAMKVIIRLGGDTDTNCAIAGAFLGAKFGYKNIPARWLEALFNSNYERPREFKINKEKINNYLKKIEK